MADSSSIAGAVLRGGDEQEELAAIEQEELAAIVQVEGAAILLDCDGVLHPYGGLDHFVPSCMRALRAIVEATGARVVLSSSWQSSRVRRPCERKRDTACRRTNPLRTPLSRPSS